MAKNPYSLIKALFKPHTHEIQSIETIKWQYRVTNIKYTPFPVQELDGTK